MHFATTDVTAPPFGDAVVWCVNMIEVQDFLPARLQDILRDSIYNGFYAELMDQVASDLDQFDALGSEPFLVFFEPPSLDAEALALLAAHGVAVETGLWQRVKQGVWRRWLKAFAH